MQGPRPYLSLVRNYLLFFIGYVVGETYVHNDTNSTGVFILSRNWESLSNGVSPLPLLNAAISKHQGNKHSVSNCPAIICCRLYITICTLLGSTSCFLLLVLQGVYEGLQVSQQDTPPVLTRSDNSQQRPSAPHQLYPRSIVSIFVQSVRNRELIWLRVVARFLIWNT